jgi:ribosomal protein L29
VSKLSEARRSVQGMDMAEAQKELKAKRRQLFELRLQHARGEVKNNRQFAQIKADVARLMFRLNELNREERLDEDEAQDEELLTEEAPPADAVPSGQVEA